MKEYRRSKTLGRTYNLGNFNSLRIEASVEVLVDESDDLEQVDKYLFEECEKSLAKDKERILAKRKNEDSE
jgi:hypothetical protein